MSREASSHCNSNAVNLVQSYEDEQPSIQDTPTSNQEPPVYDLASTSQEANKSNNIQDLASTCSENDQSHVLNSTSTIY